MVDQQNQQLPLSFMIFELVVVGDGVDQSEKEESNADRLSTLSQVHFIWSVYLIWRDSRLQPTSVVARAIKQGGLSVGSEERVASSSWP